MSDVKETVEAVAVVADKVGASTEFAFSKLEQYMGGMKEILTTYGGDVAELGLNVLRIEAGSHLLKGLFLTIITLYAFYMVFTRLHPKLAEVNNRDGFEYFVTGMIIILPTIGFFAGISKVLNLWYWVGLFWPEAYAVYKFVLN